jgi:hypothetical protein
LNNNFPPISIPLCPFKSARLFETISNRFGQPVLKNIIFARIGFVFEKLLGDEHRFFEIGHPAVKKSF